MATLVFSTIGTALGGPLGGAIGALTGRQFDGALFGPAGRKGPRLRELEVSLSSYGQAIPRLYGRMRVAGSIIWATELQEQSDVEGGGKSQPALTTYSYAANFAVALSSRSIRSVGRIWADGKLLRGVAGDLKVGGIMRIHTGAEEQSIDPLVAASEGEDRCPAFRGLAYVVFESLELADFGNRLPALTFEVIADDAVRLGDIVGETLATSTVPHELDGLAGFALEDTVAGGLSALDTVLPIAIDASGDTLVVRAAGGAQEPVLLGAAAATAEDESFGKVAGVTRRRAPPEPQPPPVLRYFDVARDYQPSNQHATGRSGSGQPEVVELPAALEASRARVLIERMALHRNRARERIAWRVCTLDIDVAPGALVRLPDRNGTWRVESWEWREAGVELELSRVAAASSTPLPTPPAAPFVPAADLVPAATRIVAFELPWDGSSGAADRSRTMAAVGATGANWSGAAICHDRGDGQLWPLSQANRTRAIVGTALDVLAAASPSLVDRTSALTIALAASDQVLSSVGLAGLANGTNLALIGDELVQFARADPLGGGQWRLSHLLRGCGGTEHAIDAHGPGERFALVDARLTTLGGTAALAAGDTIVALGRGDAEPVASPIHLAGIRRRPLAPVHGRASKSPEGGGTGDALQLAWTRRARGGWSWSDGVDVPLVEESERYLVTFEQDGTTLRGWTVGAPMLSLAADELARLALLAPEGAFHVRQQGTHALSLPLFLADLA